MSVITIDTTALGLGAKQLAAISKELESVVDDVLTANILEIDEKAKQLAPANKGFLRQHISANTTKHLSKSVNVNAPYAAYMEFGTGAYAAQWVASLPSDWQTYALQFKGKGGGTFAEMLVHLQEWVRLKGISSGDDIKSVAYLIARSIILHGVKAHPFLYPAFKAQEGQIDKDMNAAIKSLIK